jgi:hypothetical protein
MSIEDMLLINGPLVLILKPVALVQTIMGALIVGAHLVLVKETESTREHGAIAAVVGVLAGSVDHLILVDFEDQTSAAMGI